MLREMATAVRLDQSAKQTETRRDEMKPRKIGCGALGGDRLHSIMAEALQRPCVAIVIH